MCLILQYFQLFRGAVSCIVDTRVDTRYPKITENDPRPL
jgi:hypothetical protein